MLDQEFQYYLDNQLEFVKKYLGKYLVIKGNEIIGIYDSDKTAYFETEKIHEPGTFLIQYCDHGENSYTQIFHSRVAFA